MLWGEAYSWQKENVFLRKYNGYCTGGAINIYNIKSAITFILQKDTEGLYSKNNKKGVS